uniref:Uncharacterized protein n=1 Tax=Oryza meridionalis TaxID=40149 RepID=A0A0E0D2S1_9ORYZ
MVLDPLDYSHKIVTSNLRALSLRLPRIERRTGFDDTSIKNVQRDLCHECCHVLDKFFDLGSILATSDEYKALREWSNVMP